MAAIPKFKVYIRLMHQRRVKLKYKKLNYVEFSLK